jgi:photosystem II stability/assembly factor-like uncharacterized protein
MNRLLVFAFSLGLVGCGAAARPSHPDLGGGGNNNNYSTDDLGNTTPTDLGDLGGTDAFLLPDGGVVTTLAPMPSHLTLQRSGNTHDLNSAWASPGGKVYVVGAGGTIITSTGGATFTAETSTVTRDLFGVWGSSDTDVYAVGVGPTILHSTGTGTWTAMTVPPSTGATQLDNLWGSSASDVYAVGDHGLILHSNGTAWTAQPTSTTRHLHAVVGVSSTQVVAVGEAGTVFSSTGAGTWQAVTVPSSHDQWNIAVFNSAAGPAWVTAAGSGTTLRSANGTMWTYASGVGSADLRGISAVQGGFVMAADDGQVRVSSDAGATWRSVGTKVTSEPLRSIATVGASLYLVGKAGTIVLAN